MSTLVNAKFVHKTNYLVFDPGYDSDARLFIGCNAHCTCQTLATQLHISVQMPYDTIGKKPELYNLFLSNTICPLSKVLSAMLGTSKIS